MIHNDKKKLAMIIVGKEKSPENDETKSEDLSDEDLSKEALEHCMKGFMTALDSENTAKALKMFKKLTYLVNEHMEEEEDTEDGQDDYSK